MANKTINMQQIYNIRTSRNIEYYMKKWNQRKIMLQNVTR